MLTSDVCVPVMIFNLIYLQQARPLLLLLSVWYHSPLFHYSVFFCLHAILSFIHLCPAHTPSLTTSPACSYILLLFLWAHPAPPHRSPPCTPSAPSEVGLSRRAGRWSAGSSCLGSPSPCSWCFGRDWRTSACSASPWSPGLTGWRRRSWPYDWGKKKTRRPSVNVHTIWLSWLLHVVVEITWLSNWPITSAPKKTPFCVTKM